MQTLKKIIFLLSPYERKQAGFLLVLIVIMALLDVIGVASILPFMAVLTNPSLIEVNIILKTMFKVSNIFGVETNQQFLFFLGVTAFVLLIISLVLKTFTGFLQFRFIFMREFSIGKRLIEGYLQQPYSWFLSRNSADLGKGILSEVSQVIGNGINPLMELIAKSIIAFTLVTLLALVNLKLALTVSLIFGGIYLIIFYFVRKFLNQTGKKRFENNQLRFSIVKEAFDAIKDIKVGNLEKIYIENFSKTSKNYAKTYASQQVVSQLPRFILEAVAFGSVILILLYSMKNGKGLNNSLPIISLYVFAGYRLMPALQQIYSSFTQLTFILPSINKLHNDLKNLESKINYQDENKILFSRKINLNHIYFNYPNSSRTALKDINLTIAANSKVGFVGPTGCGKTTTIDIILGLLKTQKGTLEVDGKIINEKNSRAWQRLIGYVPQNIYLSDDTVIANIAFGEEFENIDQEMVKKVSKIANLHQFIIEEMPKQYFTTIGERGVRLSGGQRQRIGIARALYHNPKVLILDEATNALDNQTEFEVMESISNLDNKITIILIAHRLNTVKNCNKIFLLDKGQLKYEGTYEELIKFNNQFKINDEKN